MKMTDTKKMNVIVQIRVVLVVEQKEVDFKMG